MVPPYLIENRFVWWAITQDRPDGFPQINKEDRLYVRTCHLFFKLR